MGEWLLSVLLVIQAIVTNYIIDFFLKESSLIEVALMKIVGYNKKNHGRIIRDPVSPLNF